MKQTVHIKIGFDAKRAAQNNTGLGNYSRFVIKLLAAYRNENSYYLYIPNPRRMPFIGKIADNTVIRCPRTGFWHKLRSLWRIWGITKSITDEDINLFHGLSNELPLNIRKARKTRTIVTIHDLIFLRFPHYYRFFDRLIYRYKFQSACRNADRIIAVSACTKKDIVHYLGIAPEKIDVVYQGCANEFKHALPENQLRAVQETYRLPERFLLYVGSIEERKNLLLVVQALMQINEPIALVAIGKRTSYTRKVEHYIKTHGLESRVMLLTQISTHELPAFYRLATTFVYPSLFEGFGIPILEALCCGIPVVAAKGSCLEEAGGPGSIYIDPHNPHDLAQAIERTLTDKGLRSRMIDEGLKHAHRFDNEHLFRDLYNVYKKTLDLSFPDSKRYNQR